MIDGLITLNCEQGTDEWLEARRGIPTATGLSNIVTPSGNKSSSATGYLAKLLEEHICGLKSGFKTPDMERGNQLEPVARAAYEFETSNKVQLVGGVYLNEKKDLMISPDGLIPELRKGLEIKCPKVSTHIEYILGGVLPSVYKIQVQAGLWVTGYETWDFVSYCPEYTAQPFFMLEVQRDEKIMKAFDTYIPEFINQLNTMKKQCDTNSIYNFNEVL